MFVLEKHMQMVGTQKKLKNEWVHKIKIYNIWFVHEDKLDHTIYTDLHFCTRQINMLSANLVKTCILYAPDYQSTRLGICLQV